MLPLVPLRELGRRFFVLMSLIALVFIVLAMVDRGLAVSAWHLACAGLLVAYNVLVPRQAGPDLAPRGARSSGSSGSGAAARVAASAALAAGIATGGAGLVADALALAELPASSEFAHGRTAPPAAIVSSAVTSSFLLGAVLVAMVLGHWHLVSRKLSFAPLRRLALAAIAALVVRALSAVGAASMQRDVWRESLERAGAAAFFLSDGVFLLSRALFGLAAPAVLVFLAWRCVRIQSNQSATGILYVAVAFVFFGEILAKHFLVNLRLVV
jgi:hypothetical protein